MNRAKEADAPVPEEVVPMAQDGGGTPGCSPGQKAAWESLRREFEVQVLVWEALELSRKPLREQMFCVVLDRSRGERLGANLDRGGDGAGLKLGAISKVGLVHEWNTSGQGHALRSTDHIIEVNGCTDVNGMCQELKKSTQLELTLRRGLNHQVVSLGADAEPKEVNSDLEALRTQMEAIFELASAQPDGAARALEASLLSARETGRLPLNDATKEAARRAVEVSLARGPTGPRRPEAAGAGGPPPAAAGTRPPHRGGGAPTEGGAARRGQASTRQPPGRLRDDVKADLERDLSHEPLGDAHIPRAAGELMADVAPAKLTL